MKDIEGRWSRSLGDVANCARFIHQSALNTKVVRAGKISRIIGTSTGEIDLRSDSRQQDLSHEL